MIMIMIFFLTNHPSLYMHLCCYFFDETFIKENNIRICFCPCFSWFFYISSLRCIGSIQHLKGKYGQGYSLEVKLREELTGLQQVALLHKEIVRIFPHAARQERLGPVWLSLCVCIGSKAGFWNNHKCQRANLCSFWLKFFRHIWLVGEPGVDPIS